MTKIIWNALEKPELDQEYIVAATRGLRIRWWNPVALSLFISFVSKISDHLNDNRDCVGYSLRITWFPLEGWTLSLWRDVYTLNRFIRESVHAEAIQAPALHTKGYFKYAQWKCKGSDLPTGWEAIRLKFN